MMNQYNVLFANSGWGWSLLPILIWSLFWKGCALWIASKNNQKGWFFAILILNTVGILEIIYIFYVAKKKWADIKEIITVNKTNTTS
jgi:methionyl-tRNA synthetase